MAKTALKSNQPDLFLTPAPILSLVKSPKVYQADGKEQFVVGWTDGVAKMYEAVKASHVQTILATVEQSKSKQDEIVYCGSFFKEEGSLKVKIDVYKTIGGFHRVDLFDSVVRYANQRYDKLAHVNIVTDWMKQNKLWFRKDYQGKFESFFEYKEEFRDSFCINLEKPHLSFTLSID